MKQKLLNFMIALIAIIMPTIIYAQAQEAAGTYNGKLDVSLYGLPAGSSTENVYITTVDETHVTLEIKDFKFTVNNVVIEIGNILIPDITVQKEGNTIIILPADVKLTLPAPIESVDVHLNRSTINNKKLELTLTVDTTYPQPITVDVKFDGTQTGGSGIQNTETKKTAIYYNVETNILTIKGADNQKYDIYNVTGMHIISGILSTEEVNVSGLSKGLYLIKMENYTTKFIKK